MIDAVSNRVDQVVATKLYVAAIVLHKMEASFVAVVEIIPMEFGPFVEMMLADISIDGSYIVYRNPSVTGYSGVFNSFDDDFIHPVCRISACIDVVGVGVSG